MSDSARELWRSEVFRDTEVIAIMKVLLNLNYYGELLCAERLNGYIRAIKYKDLNSPLPEGERFIDGFVFKLGAEYHIFGYHSSKRRIAEMISEIDESKHIMLSLLSSLEKSSRSEKEKTRNLLCRALKKCIDERLERPEGWILGRLHAKERDKRIIDEKAADVVVNGKRYLRFGDYIAIEWYNKQGEARKHVLFLYKYEEGDFHLVGAILGDDDEYKAAVNPEKIDEFCREE